MRIKYGANQFKLTVLFCFVENCTFKLFAKLAALAQAMDTLPGLLRQDAHASQVRLTNRCGRGGRF